MDLMPQSAPPTDKPFGERLKEWREEHGWSRDGLANEFGVSPRTLEKWERNERMPAQLVLDMIEKRMAGGGELRIQITPAQYSDLTRIAKIRGIKVETLVLRLIEAISGNS